MRTFAEKSKSIQQAKFTKTRVPARSHFVQSHDVNSVLHLQRTIGNQVVQDLLRRNTEERNTVLPATNSTQFSRDFSQIPVRPLAVSGIQAKLVINKPGDEYEQEADRLAEQVVKMSEPKLQRTCVCGGACPKCKAKQLHQESKRLQTKRVRASNTEQVTVPPIVHGVLQSHGQPLQPATRAFMETRFEHDFSQVQVHADAQADAASRAIGARAFTLGQHIAFRNGEYKPGTAAGRWLMAHELTHTIQQEQPKYQNGSNTVQRQRHIPRQPRLLDPRVVSATSLGTMVSLTFNMPLTRGEVVSYLWPNGPNPLVNFFMPDEADPWRTDAGKYLNFLILPDPSVLRGIRQNVHRMIYEAIPVFNAQVELPNWVPDDIGILIQEAFNSEEDIHLYGRWPDQVDQYTQGLYWMQRRGRRTQIEVAQLPDPLAVRERRLREARITVNQYITSYVISEGMSISEAKSRTRERTRNELVLTLLEAIQMVIPGRIPSLAVPRPRPSISAPRVLPPRATPPPGRQPRPTGLRGLASQARDIVRRIRQAGGEVVANMGGAGVSHEPPGAININNQAVARRSIPNHINADASDIGQIFEAGSIDRVVGHHMPPGVIDWQRAVPGVRSALRPGGTFRFDWRGATPEAAQVERLLQEAGFQNIQNYLNAVITATRP